MWFYTAYGLNIRSAIALPELLVPAPQGDDHAAPVPASADVIIRLGEIDECDLPTPADVETYAKATEEKVVLHWQTVGTFLIRDGREITVCPSADADEDVIRLLLLGSVFGVLLHQRGSLALHASAVTLHGGACLFVGGSGWGKSTMGAFLHSRGHHVIADDISLINGGLQGPFAVTPAFPRLKLWPESAQAVGHDPLSLPALRQGLEKRSLAIEENFTMEPLPLRCIYILSRGADATIEPIPPTNALLELVTHAYGARLLRDVHTVSHFKRYSRIASTVPIRRLTRRWSLDDLPLLAQAVEEDAIH